MSLKKGTFENEDQSKKHPKLENETPKSLNHCTLKDNNLKVLYDASQTRWRQWMHLHLQRSTNLSNGALDFSPAEVGRYWYLLVEPFFPATLLST